MAGSMNKAMLLGRLGKDPETRNLQNGGTVTNLSLATSESWKDKSGDRQERTEWHKVVIFNEKLGEIAERYLRKGSTVLVEGTIQTRKWTDKDGADRYSTEIVLAKFGGNLTLLDKKGEGGESAGGSGRGESRSEGRSAERAKAPAGGDGFDDDIPW